MYIRHVLRFKHYSEKQQGSLLMRHFFLEITHLAGQKTILIDAITGSQLTGNETFRALDCRTYKWLTIEKAPAAANLKIQREGESILFLQRVIHSKIQPIPWRSCIPPFSLFLTNLSADSHR